MRFTVTVRLKTGKDPDVGHMRSVSERDIQGVVSNLTYMALSAYRDDQGRLADVPEIAIELKPEPK